MSCKTAWTSVLPDIQKFNQCLCYVNYWAKRSCAFFFHFMYIDGQIERHFPVKMAGNFFLLQFFSPFEPIYWETCSFSIDVSQALLHWGTEAQNSFGNCSWIMRLLYWRGKLFNEEKLEQFEIWINCFPFSLACRIYWLISL